MNEVNCLVESTDKDGTKNVYKSNLNAKHSYWNIPVPEFNKKRQIEICISAYILEHWKLGSLSYSGQTRSDYVQFKNESGQWWMAGSVSRERARDGYNAFWQRASHLVQVQNKSVERE